MTTGTMSASTVGRAHRKPKTYTEGRVCATEGCCTRLSRYNRASHCFSHAPARYPRLRGEFTEEYLAKQS
jgi:hypothetical protein